MQIFETSIIYLILGAVVATAMVLRSEQRNQLQRIGLFLMVLLFWPCFAPLLLGGRTAPPEPPRVDTPLDSRVAAIQTSLLTALSKLQGVAEEALAPEMARVRGLSSSITAMEQRLVEMDRLLGAPEFDRSATEAALAALTQRGLAEADPRVQSVRARLRNIERLQAMRVHTLENLERVILKLEEMSSQLRLLEFADRPDTEVVGLIKDIAETVEGVAEGLLAPEATTVPLSEGA